MIPPLPLSAYVAIVALLFLTFGGIQTHRLHATQKEYSAFVADVKAKGEAQEKATQETIQRDRKAKEIVDAQNRKLRSANASLSASLLDARTRGGYLPTASPGSGSPDRITFGRSELERAIAELDAGFSQIASRCDQTRIDLDSARSWAQGR